MAGWFKIVVAVYLTVGYALLFVGRRQAQNADPDSVMFGLNGDPWERSRLRTLNRFTLAWLVVGLLAIGILSRIR